jgi:hypothetical protein
MLRRCLVLLCLAVSPGAAAQSPHGPSEATLLKRYTHGAKCDPKRFRWLNEAAPDSALLQCTLATAALRAIAAHPERAAIVAQDTGILRCASFLSASFTQVGGKRSGSRAGGDRYWSVTLMSPSKAVTVRFDRQQERVTVTQEEAPMWPAKEMQHRCGDG